MDNLVTPSALVDEETGELLEQLPRLEALARLYELTNRLGRSGGASYALTEAERHRREHGHALSFGCCREVSVIDPRSTPQAA